MRDVNKKLPESFEDSCVNIGIDSFLPDVSRMSERHARATIAFYKLRVIAEDLNGGKPVGCNGPKYIPHFNYDSDGTIEFSGEVLNEPSHMITFFGIGLRINDKTLAAYFGSQFTDLWNDLLNFYPHSNNKNNGKN